MAKPDAARKVLAGLAVCLGLAVIGSPALARAQSVEAESVVAEGFSAEPGAPSEAALRLTQWVVASGDNHDVPFVVIDKVAAVVFVYDPQGNLLGAEPALLGLAHGDDSAPHIGDRELSHIAPEERTTPAGRFLANFGPVKGGKEKVLWVDFTTAISLHAVVTTNKKEHRLDRLQSPTPDDNRITFGCINVSASFYDDVVRKAFDGTRGVVYILPDTKPLDEVFPRLGRQS